ncbi:MAG TPA: hypothetical protein PKL31_12860 [Fulvivirga sp.]|nr:hypothetical protein [Fulvivirga sp.]
MKSKLLILTVAVAILGSFAFISFDKSQKNDTTKVEAQHHNTLSGITKDDTTF